eukprot:CAMPEP_0113966374 /NCGR_PEP_ID=MMETSP0011_2-20120614/8295_1 /TAXON_ID=101924 /ORGANISM="Rhodosorus marinus" /LENGTH=116 /DNA_ID=CAMNT_0000979051 /DNA_START=2087 /DNA_END=2436 /DNA_ORIENTATION=- /assembly_acc=CAM_ASM_000156
MAKIAPAIGQLRRKVASVSSALNEQAAGDLVFGDSYPIHNNLPLFKVPVHHNNNFSISRDQPLDEVLPPRAPSPPLVHNPDRLRLFSRDYLELKFPLHSVEARFRTQRKAQTIFSR